MSATGSWDEKSGDSLPHPPPPYHHHLLHASPSPDSSTSSPPSYSSRPSSPPASPPTRPQPPDSLLPLLHSLSYLSLGATAGFLTASTLRYASRTVVASAALTSLALVGLERGGLAEVRWGELWRKGWGWLEANGRGRGTGVWHALRRRWDRAMRDGDSRGEGQLMPSEAGNDDVDRWMETVEAVLTRLLSTASGVGFSIGILYALRR